MSAPMMKAGRKGKVDDEPASTPPSWAPPLSDRPPLSTGLPLSLDPPLFEPPVSPRAPLSAGRVLSPELESLPAGPEFFPPMLASTTPDPPSPSAAGASPAEGPHAPEKAAN